MAELGEALTITQKWQYDTSLVPSPVNAMLIASGGQTSNGEQSREFFLVLGLMNPPLILQQPDGSTEVQGLQEGGIAHVAEVGRYMITWERLVEFNTLLSDFIERSRPNLGL